MMHQATSGGTAVEGSTFNAINPRMDSAKSQDTIPSSGLFSLEQWAATLNMTVETVNEYASRYGITLHDGMIDAANWWKAIATAKPRRKLVTIHCVRDSVYLTDREATRAAQTQSHFNNGNPQEILSGTGLIELTESRHVQSSIEPPNPLANKVGTLVDPLFNMIREQCDFVEFDTPNGFDIDLFEDRAIKTATDDECRQVELSFVIDRAKADCGKPVLPQLLKHCRKVQEQFTGLVELLERIQESHAARRKILKAESADAAIELPEAFTLAE